MMGNVTRYVALLRGVNVGGHNKVPMAGLRSALEALGHHDVATYVQSGNAVFTAEPTDSAALGAGIAGRLTAEFGLAVDVQVRTAAELARVIASNPLGAALAEPAKLHAVFLSDQPDPGCFASLDRSLFPSEELALGERVLYVWYHDGAGRSKLTADLLDRRLRVRTTARNWRTVTALADLLGPP